MVKGILQIVCTAGSYRSCDLSRPGEPQASGHSPRATARGKSSKASIFRERDQSISLATNPQPAVSEPRQKEDDFGITVETSPSTRHARVRAPLRRMGD